jgi:hypothetical protein
VVVEPTTLLATLKCAVLAISGLEVVVLKIMRRKMQQQVYSSASKNNATSVVKAASFEENMCS